MDISVKCAHAGVTTGEWSNVMREVYGEYRAPTGIVSSNVLKHNTQQSEIRLLQKEVNLLAKKIKRRPKMLVGKPGLDGHSNRVLAQALEGMWGAHEVLVVYVVRHIKSSSMKCQSNPKHFSFFGTFFEI